MRYRRGHKAATAAAIVRAAGRFLRTGGPQAVSVPGVMKAIGLTHGGFYAHFPSKADLTAQVLGQSFEEFADALSRIAARPTADARVQALVCGYLTAQHRDDPASGCWLAALGPEIARQSGAVRGAFARACRRHRDRVAEALRLADDPAENRRRVTGLLGFLAGTLILARCTDDPGESETILADGRRLAVERFSSKIPATV